MPAPLGAESWSPAPAAPVRRTLVVSVEEELLESNGGSWGWSAMPKRFRGRSRDRLDALGERWFERRVKPRLRIETVARIRAARSDGQEILLESKGPEPVVRCLARHLGATSFTARELEYRDGRATGRVRPGIAELVVTREPVPPPAVLVDGASAPVRSVRRALAGRHVFLVGVSGFIGKVWLASLLRDLPEIGHVTLLIRSRSETTSRERFTRILRESIIFESLRESVPEFDDLVRRKITVVDGDITRPGLGLDPAEAERLHGSVDIVVSCAGLTEFNPDLRDALAVNVDGTLHLLEFTSSCATAGLLHVSTCYVAGLREGRITERLAPNETPSGRQDFDPEAEWAALRDRVEEAERRGGPVRRRLIETGGRRARELGWPNIYTYTKALGEALLARRAGPTAHAVVRPSIVESAVEFPFPGWNEGINTSCPLSHLLGTAFRQLPVNDRKRLDVIPVDTVARGLTLVAAALAERRHETVYQLATSATNPLDLARAVELTALAHGRHYREVGGWKQQILARLEAVPVSRERYERFSVPRFLRIAQRLNRRLGSWAPGKKRLVRAERTLRRIHELIELYEPFLLDQEPIHEAERIEVLSAALPPEERAAFEWDVHNLDWQDYWIRVHIPGLRRWSFPLLEGRGRKASGQRATAGKPAITPVPPATPEAGPAPDSAIVSGEPASALAGEEPPR